MRIKVIRTAMIGGGLKYEVLVRVEDVPNYVPSRYTTVLEHGFKFLRFWDATQTEEHYSMPLGWDRYKHAMEHEKESRKIVLKICRNFFPELGHYHGDAMPLLWIYGLMDGKTETSKTILAFYDSKNEQVTESPGRNDAWIESYRGELKR